ncbi:MAG: ABC transporter substrate-binding protein [Rhodoferax sp.]
MQRRDFLATSALALGLPAWVQAQDTDLAGLYAQAKGEGKVVMYTSVPSFLLDRWKILFQAKFPGIEVEFFRSGTGKVLARVETEARAGAVRGDVVWLADPTAFNGLVAQKQLLSYQPPEWQHITLAKHPEGYYAAGRILVGCLLVNPKAGGAGVKSFADLTKPALKGKVVIASPLISGSTHVIDGALWKDPRFGWKYFEQLKKNEVLVLNDVPDVARAVASGERAAGISLTLYKYQPEYANSPMQIVLPTEGAIPMASPLGVFAKAPHPAAAKLFYRFLLSPIAQNVLAEAGIYPARDDVPAPNGLPDYDKLKKLPPDFDWIENNRRDNQAQWRALFGG